MCAELFVFMYDCPNGAEVFCFLSSLPLLPQATTAVFGSYLTISLLLTKTVSPVCACLFIQYDWRGFVGAANKTSMDLLVFCSILSGLFLHVQSPNL